MLGKVPPKKKFENLYPRVVLDIYDKIVDSDLS